MYIYATLYRRQSPYLYQETLYIYSGLNLMAYVHTLFISKYNFYLQNVISM